MFDPSIGRWSQEDPKRFQAGDTNLDRYVENAPTNATDPSGLQEQVLGKKVLEELDAALASLSAPPMVKTPKPHPPLPMPKETITIPKAAGFQQAPLIAAEFSAFTWELQTSAVAVAKNFARDDSGIEVIGAKGLMSINAAMDTFVSNNYGPGFHAKIVEFRITGLSFYPPDMERRPPRFDRELMIPVLVKREGQKPTVEIKKGIKGIALAHFLVQGFWIFEITDDKGKTKEGVTAQGKPTTLFALDSTALGASALTRGHTPYQKEFYDAIHYLNEEYKADKTIEYFMIGRGYDGGPVGGVQGLEGFKDIKHLETIRQVRAAKNLPAVSVRPGDAGSDLQKIQILTIAPQD
jgi:hypothetical protein